MTINLAVPYYEEKKDYGFILLVDRRGVIRVSSDTQDVSHLDNVVLDLSKFYVSDRTIAIATGKIDMGYKEVPKKPTYPFDLIIQATIDGQTQNLPFDLLPNSEYSIFVVEINGRVIDFYKIYCNNGNRKRTQIAEMNGNILPEMVCYVNGHKENRLMVSIKGPPPNKGRAIQFARAMYSVANMLSGNSLNGQDLFEVSPNGIIKRSDRIPQTSIKEGKL